MLKSLFKKKSKKQPKRARASSASFAQQFLEREANRHEDRLQKEKSKNQHRRQEERSDCFTIATVLSPDTGGTIDGVLLDASRNGVTFRPAAHYIPVIDGDQIQISCAGIERIAIVRSTRPDGYGIQVFDPFSDEELSQIYDASIELDLATQDQAA